MHAQKVGNALTAGRLLSGAVCLLASTPLCHAASPLVLAGSLLGSVRDSSGVPQMGAVVQLYNRNERLVEKAVTTASGEFAFTSLIPDVYSIRVSVASF